MSTTLFAAFRILAPVHGFLRKFGAARIAAVERAASPRTGFPSIIPTPLPIRTRELSLMPAIQAPHHPRARTPARASNRTNPPLRVVRLMESGQAGAHGGRMLISGRMADVCAELDRMAAREAAMHAGA